jgi:hypothetical protein
MAAFQQSVHFDARKIYITGNNIWSAGRPASSERTERLLGTHITLLKTKITCRQGEIFDVITHKFYAYI